MQKLNIKKKYTDYFSYPRFHGEMENPPAAVPALCQVEILVAKFITLILSGTQVANCHLVSSSSNNYLMLG